MKNIFGLLLSALVSFTSFGQPLTGIKTVPGDYATIAAAIAALNASGVGTGGVTFNVTAGHTETFATLTAGVISTTSGSFSNPIVFQKSGNGANPLITAAVVSTTSGTDGIIKFAGCDHVTFDAINLQENAANVFPNSTDWGYAILKESGTNGSQYITIKNCTVTLNKVNSLSVGVYLANHTATSTSSLTVTNVSGTNSNEKIYSNSISNAYKGISLNGYSSAAPYAYYDQSNEIGKDGANTITNFGGGSNAAPGIYAIYQNGLSIANNSITGGNGTTTNVYGIWTSTGINSNLDIIGNTITLVSASTVTTLYGINNEMGGSGTNNTVSINNNTITNCSYPTATSAPFYLLYQQSGAYNFNCYGNNITNNTLGAAGTSAIGPFGAIYTTGSNTLAGSVWNINNNTISGNNRVQSAIGGGLNYYIYSGSSGVTLNIYGNIVDNNTAASNGVTAGIYISSSASYRFVHSNILKNFLNANGIIYGIYNGSGVSTYIFNNRVANLNGVAPGSLVYGVYIHSGSYNHVYNNLISELFSPAAFNPIAAAGIYINGGSSGTLSFNTIYLDAASTEGSFGTAGIFASTSPTMNLRSNIVVNNSIPGSAGLTVAYRRSNTNLWTYDYASDHNDFYAGIPGPGNLIFYDGFNADQTLADFKSRVAPMDANSFTENPPFINKTTSPYDLHLSTTIQTQCESGGMIVSNPIPIITDIDDDPRYPEPGYPDNAASPAFAPDCGADEFDGLFLDLFPPVITYNPLPNSLTPGERTLHATITDFSGVPVAGTGLPVVYWKINAGSWNATAGTFLSGNLYAFSFGAGTAVNDVVSYYITAQDAFSTPNVTSCPLDGAAGFTFNPPACATPPSTPNTYSIITPMSGLVTVGIGGDYTSLTSVGGLFEAINLGALSGNLTVNVISDLTEDGTHGLNEWIETDPGGYTLTIKSDAAVNRDITGSYAEGLIRINGADRVTFDGSIQGTGRYLSIFNLGPNSSYNVIEFQDGSNYNTIKNCLISGNTNGMSTAISADGGTSGLAGFSNNIFDNNVLESVAYGVYIWGQAGDPATDNQVTNNTIGSMIIDRHVSFQGVSIGEADNTLIQGNEIIGHATVDGPNWQVGVYLYQGSVNSKVRKNKIHDFYYDGSGGFGVQGIRFAGDATSLTEISNNVIYSFRSDGDNSSLDYIPSGIYIESGGNCRIVYNSIYLYGASLTDDYDGFSTGIAINNGVTLLDIRNNVIHNSMSAAYGTTSKTYAIYCLSPNSAFTYINNNDYFVNGITPNIGFLGIDRSSLASWSAATMQDLLSKNSNPLFVSLTDLHPMSLDLYNSAVPIPGITDDYSGITRVGLAILNQPTIGAYEVPQISGGGITNLTLTSATLHGTINACGYYTVINPTFEYGLTTTYTHVAAALPATITGSGNTPVTAGISGLLPNMTYHYRLNASWGGNSIIGLDNTFTTSTDLPTVITDPAASITQSSAMLHGTVNANGNSTTATFEFGTSTAYGQTFTATTSPVTGNANTPVSYSAGGLLPNTAYHFRAVGTNANGITYGLDQVFELLPTPAITGPANVCQGSSGNVYTTEAGKTNYTWIVSAGGNITSGGGSTDNTATITWMSPGDQTVSVNYQNSGGNPAPVPTVYPVTVNPLPGIAGAISGPSTVMQGQAGVIFSVAAITNASGYIWSLPAGASITAGDNSNSITVSFSGSTVSGIITVFGTNSCGNGMVSSNFNVTVESAVPENLSVTGLVSGPACYNATNTIIVAGTGTTFTVQSGGQAEMIAGAAILYKPGTTVQSGGYMWGHIAPAGPWCITPTVPSVALDVSGKKEGLEIAAQSFQKIYPNPTSGEFILELTGNIFMATVSIYGIMGEKILTREISGDENHKFSLSDRPSGIYFIRAEAGAKAETVKIIKQ